MLTEDVNEMKESLVECLIQDHSYNSLSSKQLADVAEIVSDHSLLYRFLKKYKLERDECHLAILSHLNWRIRENVCENNLESSTPAMRSYLEKGLFRFLDTDKSGRPVAYIMPRIFIPDTIATTEDLKNTLILCLETLRRWIYSLQQQSETLIAQALVVVNLEGFGYSNMDYGLVPVIYELFRHQYPQLLGQVLVLNYGWFHSGIWNFLAPIMTAEARAKLVFIAEEQLIEYISVNRIPKGTSRTNLEFGGKVQSLSDSIESCKVMHTYDAPLCQQYNTKILDQILSLSNQSANDNFSVTQSVPRSVKSAADLQLMLSGFSSRGFKKIHSSGSLLNLRSKSYVNVRSNEGIPTTGPPLGKSCLRKAQLYLFGTRLYEFLVRMFSLITRRKSIWKRKRSWSLTIILVCVAITVKKELFDIFRAKS